MPAMKDVPTLNENKSFPTLNQAVTNVTLESENIRTNRILIEKARQENTQLIGSDEYEKSHRRTIHNSPELYTETAKTVAALSYQEGHLQQYIETARALAAKGDKRFAGNLDNVAEQLKKVQNDLFEVDYRHNLYGEFDRIKDEARTLGRANTRLHLENIRSGLDISKLGGKESGFLTLREEIELKVDAESSAKEIAKLIKSP